MPIEMVCENCKQPFYCYESDAENGRKYCTLACRSAHRFNKETPAPSRVAVPFTCKECGNGFTMTQGYLTAYRKKFDKDPLYCSINCSNQGRRKDTEERNKFTCVNCGKACTRQRNKCGRIYREQKLCSRQCKNEWVSKVYREKHGLAVMTRRVKRRYAVLHIPARDGQPFHEILEHRYVMEQKIERKLLPAETVHHINGIKTDNRIENLELFSSRHGPGQRVIDKVAFAIEILTLYPEFCQAAGYELKTHVSDAPAVAGILSALC